MLNPWLSFSFEAARLGWEAQNGMALRLMRLAGGGAADQSEPRPMVAKAADQSEPRPMVAKKAAAPAKAHTARTAAVKRSNGRHVAKKAASGHKKPARGNKRK
jgi:hypothetical protein